MPNTRQIAFDIVHRLRAASSHAQIYAELQRVGTTFGYDSFIITGLPRNPTENLEDCKLISGWPIEWEQRYLTNRYMHVDPVIAHIRGVSDPFLWRDAVEATGASRGMVVMHEAREFGLFEGLCVPFHQLNGSEAGVSFGGRAIRLSDDERAALHLVALYAMSSAKAVARVPGARPTSDDRGSLLTEREVECLRWSSAGKSAWDISVILSISQRTVEQHLASAGRKLQAVSRTHSVAEALRRGFID